MIHSRREERDRRGLYQHSCPTYFSGLALPPVPWLSYRAYHPLASRPKQQVPYEPEATHAEQQILLEPQPQERMQTATPSGTSCSQGATGASAPHQRALPTRAGP